MRIFCTIFDKNYLYQGVALYNSLDQVAGDFKLYALCMDDVAYTVVNDLRLKKFLPIKIDSLLTEEVLAIRKRTTHGQFCWLCQPLLCQHVLDEFDVDMVTYLEADSLFFSNPEVLFEEIGDMSVSLSPHNYSPEFDKSATSGKFCTQFNAFKNDQSGREILKEWKRLGFLYDKARTSFYPHQSLLDEWPGKFDSVRVLNNPGAGVAPWNIQRYHFSETNSVPMVDGFPVIFYHFHSYGRYENGDHELGRYPISDGVKNSIYKKYIHEIKHAEDMVHAIAPTFNFRRKYENIPTLMKAICSFSSKEMKEYIQLLKRRLNGTYNIFPDSYFS